MSRGEAQPQGGKIDWVRCHVYACCGEMCRLTCTCRLALSFVAGCCMLARVPAFTSTLLLKRPQARSRCRIAIGFLIRTRRWWRGAGETAAACARPEPRCAKAHNTRQRATPTFVGNTGVGFLRHLEASAQRRPRRATFTYSIRMDTRSNGRLCLAPKKSCDLISR